MITPTKRGNAQPLVNFKTTALGRESKFGECDAIAFRFLHFWCVNHGQKTLILSDLLFAL